MVNPRDIAGNTEEEEMVNPRDTAGNTEEEEKWWTPEILLGMQKKKNGEPQRYSWEHRRRRKMVNPRDTAGNAEEQWTQDIQLGTQKKNKNGEPNR